MKKKIRARTQGGRALKEHMQNESKKKTKSLKKQATKKRGQKVTAATKRAKKVSAPLKTGRNPISVAKPAPKKSAPKRNAPNKRTPKERIQKVLANAGLASRRKIESWILEGRIKVGGKSAELGQRIGLNESVTLNGKPIYLAEKLPDTMRIIIYNKPVGLVSTREDPDGRPTVFQDLPPIQKGRWINVGRLDLNTSGLMLFTNNGELAHKLMHPSSQLEREYAVRVRGTVTSEITKKLVEGIRLEDGMARFEDLVEAGGEGYNQWFYVVVAEGRNRLVRRLWESQDLEVSKLKRVRFGPVMLPKSLRKGSWMELEADIFDTILAAPSSSKPH